MNHIILGKQTGTTGSAISMSVFPIIRMSAKMHYSKDKNPGLLNTVDNTVWETVYKTTPDVVFYDWPGSWVVDNFLNAFKHLDREIITKSLFAFFVVFNRFVKLCFCLRMK